MCLAVNTKTTYVNNFVLAIVPFKENIHGPDPLKTWVSPQVMACLYLQNTREILIVLQRYLPRL